MEVQRMANIAPEGFPHRCREEVKIEGLTIPKNTLVVPLFAELFRGNHWVDPDSFNPTRFLDEDSNVVKNEFFIPFSIGKRVCPGESLAKSELFLFFSGLLQKFTLNPSDSNATLTDQYQPGATSIPLPFATKIIRRY